MEVWLHWGVFVAVFTTVTLLLVSSLSLVNQPKLEQKSQLFFYLSSYVSQMFLYGCIIAMLQLALFLVIPEHIVIFTLSTCIVAFVFSYFCLSSFVYTYFRYSMGFHKLDIVSSLPRFSSGFPGFSVWFLMSCGFFLSIIGAFLLEFLAWNLDKWRVTMTPFYVIATILLVTYIVNQIWYILLNKSSNKSLLQSVASIPGYKFFSWGHLYTIISKVESIRNEVAVKQKTAITMKRELHYPLKTMNYAFPNEKNKQKNVLMIVIDSWRFDALTQHITPNIYNFSKKSLLFQNHWSSGNTSTMGMMGLLYGLSGNYFPSLQLYRKQPPWMVLMQQEKYEMLFLSKKSYFGLPIDKTNSVTKYHLQLDNNLNAIDWNNKITQKTLDFLEGRDQNRPFFGCIYYCGSYTEKEVCEVPERFKPSLNHQKNHLYRTSNQEKYINYYYNVLHYIDTMVGEILEKLQNKADLENTCVIITADCGHEFNDLKKNYWGQYSNFSRFQTKVPCVIFNLAKDTATIDYRTSHYDVLPSVMNQLFSIENSYADYSLGQSLLDSNNPAYTLVSNGCYMGLVTDNNIINLYKNGEYQYFDHEMNCKDFNQLDEKIFSSALADMQRFYI